jgi:hypothetical protein
MNTKKIYKINTDGDFLGEETVLANRVYSLLGNNLDFKEGDIIVNFLFTEISPPQISGTQTLNFNNGEWLVIDGQDEVEQKELDEKEKAIALEKEKHRQELIKKKIELLEELIVTKEKLNTLTYSERIQIQAQISELKLAQ